MGSTPGQETQPEKRAWHKTLRGTAPDFELVDLDGTAVKLSALRGKTVVLEWFSPSCPVVKAAHAKGGALASLPGRMHAQENVVWLGINSAHPSHSSANRERMRKTLRKLGIDYPVLLDPTGWVGRMYEVRKTPHLLVIDARGKLAYDGGHADGNGRSLIEPALHAVLAGSQPAQAHTKAHGCKVPYAEGVQLGACIPPVRLKNLEDHEVDLARFRGKPLVIEWFNPTCPYTVRAHEDGVLSDAASRWAAKGVAWVGVNSAGEDHITADPEVNREALSSFGLVHPLLMDPTGRVGRLFEAQATPHMFVLDARGVLVYDGAHDDLETGESLLDAALSDLLAGRPVARPETIPYGCSVKFARR